MEAVALVATLATPLTSTRREIQELPRETSWLQVRADLTGDISANCLRRYFPGKVIYTLRSSHHGGSFQGTSGERHARLTSAAKEYDLVELEADSDLSPVLLAAIPHKQRLISWRGPARDGSLLRSVFARLAAVPAHSYCLTTTAVKASDGLQPLLLLQSMRRKDVTAFCEGASGFWSRVLAPYFGSQFLFGRIGKQADHADGPDLQQLIEDYGFPGLRPIRELYGMVGGRIFQSPSPRLHNAGYRNLNYPALFVPFYAECFEEFWKEMVDDPALKSLGLPIQGLTIVAPHKEAALLAAGSSSPMVRQAASTNVFVRKNGIWEADTTDPESVEGLRRNGTPAQLKAAVVGCGGAGRAVAAALQQAGADVTLVNRGKERGDRAVKLLGLPFVLLSEFAPSGFTLLVNATPVGREEDVLPFPTDTVTSNTVVVDLAYGPHPTPLVSQVLARGGTAIDGYDVLLTQVRKQFRMMVGRELPSTIGREIAVSGHSSNGFSMNVPVTSQQLEQAGTHEWGS